MLTVANTGSCVGLQNKIGHPAHPCKQSIQVHLLPRNINRLQYMVTVFLGSHSEIVDV